MYNTWRDGGMLNSLPCFFANNADRSSYRTGTQRSSLMGTDKDSVCRGCICKYVELGAGAVFRAPDSPRPGDADS